MSTSIHQLIMLPGAQTNLFCKDGLLSTDVLQIKSIFRFGGYLNFINCGAQNEYVTLKQAKWNMFNLLHHHVDKANTQKYQDYHSAFEINENDMKKF